MTSKIKHLSIALAAVAVMSMVAASAAQAGAFDVPGVQPATFTGQSIAGQEHEFTVTLTSGSKVPFKCPAATFEGTVQSQVDITDVTVTPTYGPGCKIAGIASTWRMNGCKYTYTGAGQPAGTFLVDIVGCTAGTTIELEQTGTKCKLTIGEQNGLSHLVFVQKNMHAEAKFTLAGITAMTDVGCPNAGDTFNNITFTGNTTMKAFTDGGTVQKQAPENENTHVYTEHLCGAEVALVVT